MTIAWAKYDAKDDSRHPLVDHCVDVGVVFRALLEIRTLLRGFNQDLTSVQKDRLAVFAYLHDFGKCNWGFQAKLSPSPKERAGHVLEGMALLQGLQDLWPAEWTDLLTESVAWFNSEEQFEQMLVATLSHHGRPISLNDYEYEDASNSARRWWLAQPDYDPCAALKEVAMAARTAFPNAFSSDAPLIDATADFQQRFAGLVMFADWIGSNTSFFPYRASPDEDRVAFAHDAARKALERIGMITPDVRESRSFQEIFGFEATYMQSLLAHDLDVSDDTRLILVESDTGSGKTEAALAWFLRLYIERQVDGLYFALPTRVAARELYDRVHRAVENAFESAHQPRPVLLAAPGYVKVDGRDAQELLTDPYHTIWDDDKNAWLHERLWSAERPKRFLAAPIAVGTIDQALLSALQVKHSLLRSVCLDRHLLVVDEVHASDPYMREVLRVLLQRHLEHGGWALLLSATLGDVAAAVYFNREIAPIDTVKHRPYPLVSTLTRQFSVENARHREIEVELSPTLTDDSALVARLVEALKAEARVLVVCNTVGRANALFQSVETALSHAHPELLSALFSLNGVCCPHHGRFAREDRERLDAAVTETFGKASPQGARLIIGTQTLEQSLDIDADWLVTDLAPMDVLIQRFGRLHRHPGRTRPSAFRDARALVRVPENDLATYLHDDHTLRAPAGLGIVYVDGRVLQSTWQSLAADPLLELPQQARARIEATTHPDALNTLPQVWQDHRYNLFGRELSEIRQAMSATLANEPFGSLHYRDKSEHVVTRLGDPTYDIPIKTPLSSPFGISIGHISVPSRWLPETEAPASIEAEPTTDGFRFLIGKQAFSYSRLGLERENNV